MTRGVVPPAAGLDMFAAAWVERFEALGGDLVAFDDGRVTSFIPEPGVGRRADEPDDWRRGRTDGAFRELQDLLALVPGGRAAVWIYVRQFAAQTAIEGGLATW